MARSTTCSNWPNAERVIPYNVSNAADPQGGWDQQSAGRCDRSAASHPDAKGRFASRCFSSTFEFWILLGSRRPMREIRRQHLLGADWADFWRMPIPPERLEHPDGVCVRSCSDRLVPIVLGLRASAPNPPHPRSQLLGPDAADRLSKRE
jgi:hypothetical protein